MVRLPGIYKQLWMLAIPFAFYGVGKYIDSLETLRLTMFRDKSMLYGRELKAGEPPSWP